MVPGPAGCGVLRLSLGFHDTVGRHIAIGAGVRVASALPATPRSGHTGRRSQRDIPAGLVLVVATPALSSAMVLREDEVAE